MQLVKPIEITMYIKLENCVKLTFVKYDVEYSMGRAVGAIEALL